MRLMYFVCTYSIQRIPVNRIGTSNTRFIQINNYFIPIPIQLLSDALKQLCNPKGDIAPRIYFNFFVVILPG